MKIFLGFGIAAVLSAQQLDLSALDKLASGAKEFSNVQLDESKLKLASQFLSDGKGSEKRASDVVLGLKGVFVKTFEFEADNGYADADLEPIKAQLRGDKSWTNIISHKEPGESSEIWFYSKTPGQLEGMVVLASEKRELTVVNIVGPLDSTALGNLGGKMGIPKMRGVLRDATKTKPPAPAVKVK